MSTNTIGPWPRKDYDNFLALDCECIPHGSPGEAEDLSWEAERARLASLAFEERMEHPVCVILKKKSPNFAKALKVFNYHIKRGRNAKLVSPIAPLLFLREIVRHAGYIYKFQGIRSVLKFGASPKRRTRVKKLATELLSELPSGVRLENWEYIEQLRNLLQQLVSELGDTKRKEYGGKREGEREGLRNLARSLYGFCGVASPTILTHFASMVGIDCSEATAKRYCNEVKEEAIRKGWSSPPTQ